MGDAMQFRFVTQPRELGHAHQLEALFRARHAVYAEELGWVPRSESGLERDAFDTSAAAHLVVTDGDEVIAGSRLIQTDLPHLLSEVFPTSCNRKAMPRDSQVVEWTRGFIVRHRRDERSKILMAQCCAAVMEYCMLMGYRQVGGIQDRKWLALWRLMGWQVHIHGDALDIDGAPWLPAYFDVTQSALEGARRVGQISGPILSQ